MGWDRHELLWDGMGQKKMSHGQACEALKMCHFQISWSAKNVCQVNVIVKMRVNVKRHN